jgi:hypothetical protein
MNRGGQGEGTIGRGDETASNDHADALYWLKKAEANTDRSAVLTARLFEAMCHFRDGRPDEGRRLLKAATEAIDRDLPKPGVGRIGAYQDWLICQIAKREAEKTIK